ncbi:hypothetical protein, partial [Catenovulum agarivorans]|uniref:hypothetical protein n=1 Tax=Catenovulum agarivorans TaxID=1172192 RepID=UPI0005509F61
MNKIESSNNKYLNEVANHSSGGAYYPYTPPIKSAYIKQRTVANAGKNYTQDFYSSYDDFKP